MPNPMPDPDGGPQTWYFRLSCGDAITHTEQFGYEPGAAVRCPGAGHGTVTVVRGETSEEVDARFG